MQVDDKAGWGWNCIGPEQRFVNTIFEAKRLLNDTLITLYLVAKYHVHTENRLPMNFSKSVISAQLQIGTCFSYQ